jgi:hypothetical protein
VALYQMSYVRIFAFCNAQQLVHYNRISSFCQAPFSLFLAPGSKQQEAAAFCNFRAEISSDSDTFFVFYSFHRYAIITAKIT